MDINNNQHINTFTKGMNTDVSDALIDSSQYRYAENLRLVTNTDSNEGELRMIEGTGAPLTGPWDEILAMTAIRNYLIVIAMNIEKVGNEEKRYVSILTHTNKGLEDVGWRYIVYKISYEDFIQPGEDKPHFSLVTRWESDSNIKLYIADGVRSIICLNITKDYTRPNGEYNTILDIAAYVTTNLTAPTVEISGGGKLKVARVLYAYRLYNTGEPATHMSPLSQSKEIYRTQNEGYKLEALSNKCAIINTNLTEDAKQRFERILIYRITYVQVGLLPVVDLVYDGSAMIETITDYGLSIENIATEEFLAMYTTPIIPKVIESKEDYMFAGNNKYELDKYDQLLSDLDFRAYSSGDSITQVEEPDPEEYPTLSIGIVNLSTGDVYWPQHPMELEPDPEGEGIPLIDWRELADDPNSWDYVWNPETGESDTIYYCAYFRNPNRAFYDTYWIYSNNKWNQIAKPSRYTKTEHGYNAQFAAENRNTYDPEYWMDSTTNKLGGHGPVVSWYFDIKKVYFDLYNNAYDELALTITDEINSLLRGEVYRYGIVLYNNNGIRSSVKWIADIMVPDKEIQPDLYHNSNYPIQLPTYNGTTNKWKFSRVGIHFDVNTAAIEDCAGFEIVRCKRNYQDSHTISQGIIGIPERVYKFVDNLNDNVNPNDEGGRLTTDVICPTGFMTTQNIVGFPTQQNISTLGKGVRYAEPDPEYLQFASPEYCYQPDDIQEAVLAEGDNLWIEDIQHFVMDNTSVHIQNQDDNFHQLETLGIKLASLYKFDTLTKLLDNQFSKVICRDDRITVTYHPVELPGQDPWYDVDINISSPVPARLDLDIIKGESLPVNNNEGYFVSRPNIGHGWHETMISHVVAMWDDSYLEDPMMFDSPMQKRRYEIFSAAFPDVPLANAFYDAKYGSWRNDVTPIEGALYCGWTAQGILSELESDRTQDQTAYEYYSRTTDRNEAGVWDNGRDGRLAYPISSTGKCIVFKLKEATTTQPCSMILPITVSNLKRDAVPYNGPDSYEEHSPEYCSYGNYANVNSLVPITGIDVYDGDCYPGIFVYHSAHSFDNSVLVNANKGTVIYYVPLESRIDLRATYGDIYTRIMHKPKSYYVQDVAGDVDGFILNKDAYLYNTAYGAEPDILGLSLIDYRDIYQNDFDTRVHHSELKTNNEYVDSWTFFKPLNYIDVDSRFGEITNMRLFKDKLLYWLKDGVGVLGVNERAAVTDQDSNAIILGTGAVLARFDYISTKYGMKKNLYEAEIQSNYVQYWWDGIRKEILGYNTGMQLTPLTEAKGLRNYINMYEEQDKPTLVYNAKYDEVICSVVEDKDPDSHYKNSLVFNEKIDAFTSVYTMMPLFRAVIDDTTIITGPRYIYHMDCDTDGISLLENSEDYGTTEVHPLMRYVVNALSVYVKVFDITTFGGRFYGGDTEGVDKLTFTFKTPLKLESTDTGTHFITNREYDFRLAIPRNENSSYGDRMRGKTMQCEIKSSSNSYDFSLQYIITKFRMSWS